MESARTRIKEQLRFKKSETRAFTLVELVVTIAVIGVLAVVFFPALVVARDKSNSLTAICLNNHRQLITAAIMYADDNNDTWLPNNPSGGPAWCGLQMDFFTNNSGNTNITLLTNAAICVIAPYIKNPEIFHCPADKSSVGGQFRIRSVSMSQAVGTSAINIGCMTAGGPVNGQWLTGANLGFGCQTVWRTYGKTSQMLAPKPASLWVFCDEHPGSINDAMFAVEMSIVGPFGTIIDFPASYHDGAGNFSFADGHVETHKWVGQSIQPPLSNTGANIGNHSNPAGDSTVDLTWLQQHTSARR